MIGGELLLPAALVLMACELPQLETWMLLVGVLLMIEAGMRLAGKLPPHEARALLVGELPLIGSRPRLAGRLPLPEALTLLVAEWPLFGAEQLDQARRSDVHEVHERHLDPTHLHLQAPKAHPPTAERPTAYSALHWLWFQQVARVTTRLVQLFEARTWAQPAVAAQLMPTLALRRVVDPHLPTP